MARYIRYCNKKYITIRYCVKLFLNTKQQKMQNPTTYSKERDVTSSDSNQDQKATNFSFATPFLFSIRIKFVSPSGIT